jgi:broad specificity phosphatase PhoE
LVEHFTRNEEVASSILASGSNSESEKTMKEIYIIRHAESTSNAGQRTENHHGIPLSEKGIQQAQELAETITIVPDLIVISPFTRTHETAKPFIEKHPSVPVEMWDVHEFSYLPSKAYEGTTGMERFAAAFKYWTEASVHHKESDDSESFADLTKRMADLIEKLESRPEKTIVIFSHGRFIYGLKFYLKKIKELGRRDLTDLELEDLKKSHANIVIDTIQGGAKFPIDNVSVHKLEI